MDGESGEKGDLQSLLQAIESTQVIEDRIPLINQLDGLNISKNSNLDLLGKCLATFWEESTCSGISQCTLNKSILHVAARYMKSSEASCLSQYLVLGARASMWCRKHLQMMVAPVEETQDDEHSDLFFQLVLDSFSFASATFSALVRSPIFGDNALMLIVENFISEQLNLTMVSISEIKIPVLYGSGPSIQLAWNPMFSLALCALKTFMIVAASNQAWVEVESFLLENLLHPHCLCWEIIMELWCFLVRHAEMKMLNGIIDSLFLIFKTTASMDSGCLHSSALRKMARSICIILSYATPATIGQVYSSIFANDKPCLSSVMCTALLIEGFPLHSLTQNLRKQASQKILTAFCDLIENNDRKLGVDCSSRSFSSAVLVPPIYAFLSLLRSIEIHHFDFDIDNMDISQILRSVVAVIHGYRKTTSNLKKDNLSKILSQLLEIMSTMKHFYASEDVEEVILELQALFLSEPSASDVWLSQSKPALASFMSGLSQLEMAESEGSKISSAIWELYHMLLRDRHWAFIHLALAAFGYFAARTSCTQLWRFVPQDAALSFDMEMGKNVNEERFMSELKAFLEKEAALSGVTPCNEQFRLLVKEGLVLKETVQKFSKFGPDIMQSQVVEINDDIEGKKKRKLPDGINEGMSLLQRGLKALGDGLAIWRLQPNDSKELDELSSQLSRLEDVISSLIGLADRNSSSANSAQECCSLD